MGGWLLSLISLWYMYVHVYLHLCVFNAWSDNHFICINWFLIICNLFISDFICILDCWFCCITDNVMLQECGSYVCMWVWRCMMHARLLRYNTYMYVTKFWNEILAFKLNTCERYIPGGPKKTEQSIQLIFQDLLWSTVIFFHLAG